jgi:pimeloyl-ACP methyl ester carboxylesterase
MRSTVQSFRTPDGVTLGVEAFGDPAAPLVLLAGGPTMLSWPDALCEALASGGRHVVRYDLRDCGAAARRSGRARAAAVSCSPVTTCGPSTDRVVGQRPDPHLRQGQHQSLAGRFWVSMRPGRWTGMAGDTFSAGPLPSCLDPALTGFCRAS